ncbi:AzlC family ABC transporter permease [Vreelandella utahensis]|uniref:AzlC family ABC transporter permease n=1 Tax=Vreelandella halophila TaxID=86177 RepID=UPI000986446F|nr:AzlC family ABC transporter permease [Halomonas utahensis]
MKSLFQGVVSSLSIAAGYIPIAFGFALTAMEAGLSPELTLLVSIAVFAGASQFILVALLASGAGIVSTLGTVLMMNARHLFYGPAILPRLKAAGRGLPTPLLAFGLTDEVFATASGHLEKLTPEARETWLLGLEAGAYSAWVGGTLLGVTLGAGMDALPPAVDAALEFILPALFFVLLLEVGVRQWLGTILTTALVSAALMTVLPGYHALVLGMLAGGAFNLLGGRP